MNSESKVSINKDVLARWTQKHLGKGLRHHQEINDGWFNTIYVLELADNSKAVLKVSPSPSFDTMRYEQDILATEVAVHRFLSKKGFSVPTVLVDCPDGDGLEHSWFLMEFVEGASLAYVRETQPTELCTQLDVAVAKQTALINNIQGNRFGRWKRDHCSSPLWSQSFQLMVEDLLADAGDKGVLLPWPIEQVREIVRSSQLHLDEVEVPRLVLWDLHDGNVMVKPDSLELTAFLDTDRTLWGDPLMEFYFRTLANASPDWQDSYRMNCIEMGTIHPLDCPGAAQRMSLYELYLALVMLIEATYRGFSSDHKTWAYGNCVHAMQACASN